MTKRLPARAAALATTMLAFAGGAWAQTAQIQGNVSAFDVLNYSGQPAHGFEIQLEGALPNELYYTGFGGRYGSPAIIPYATGVYVRYQSSYINNKWTATTAMANGLAFSWNDCYLGGANYNNSGCEHLGQSLRPTTGLLTITGRWLIEDPANPGTLIYADPPAAIPQIGWAVISTGTAPVVTATIPAPVPPPPPALFSDAVWVKIYKTELPRSVDGTELTSDNTTVVPEDPTQLETSFTLLQKAPPGSQNQKGKPNHVSSAPLSITAGSVVRRYETYSYTGVYDSITHEALCADLVCNAPSTGELGNPLSAHNAASNVVADSLTVNMTGSGASSAKISVGGTSCSSATCANFASSGAVVSLVANPSGTIFTGWTGACTGTSLTCSATINGKTVVGAQFLKIFTLSVGRSNPGTIAATPDGIDRALNCGSNCSAKYADGTSVTLTATPPAGKTFVNWSGACSGTAPTCTVVITKDTSAQAVFSK